ncbi:MAG TPA: diacylglycerol kinase family protein [Pyrinomonadaceae bacterium]|nr:diacylglycerol kinase family protein [Pyrinomonadaceae bacterium]
MSDTARLLVIGHFAAARARRAWPQVRAALDEAGLSYDFHATRGKGDARGRTREALREGYATVAAVGGDGTLSEVASGFFAPCDALGDDELPRAVNPRAALAVLPAGTGDDFARGLAGGTRRPLQSWLARLVRHARATAGGGVVESEAVKNDAVGGVAVETTRAVDVMAGSAAGGEGRFVCLNAATLGIGAEVASLVAAQRGVVLRLSGEARFALAAVRALARWREREMRVSVDGGGWRVVRTNIAAVMGGTHAGGGMNFSPDARPDDGLLDVVTARDLTRREIVRELARIHRGGHLANPKVRVERGSRVRIETSDDGDPLGIEADGEPRGHTPVELRVMPLALRVVW